MFVCHEGIYAWMMVGFWKILKFYEKKKNRNVYKNENDTVKIRWMFLNLQIKI